MLFEVVARHVMLIVKTITMTGKMIGKLSSILRRVRFGFLVIGIESESITFVAF